MWLPAALPVRPVMGAALLRRGPGLARKSISSSMIDDADDIIIVMLKASRSRLISLRRLTKDGSGVDLVSSGGRNGSYTGNPISGGGGKPGLFGCRSRWRVRSGNLERQAHREVLLGDGVGRDFQYRLRGRNQEHGRQGQNPDQAHDYDPRLPDRPGLDSRSAQRVIGRADHRLR